MNIDKEIEKYIKEKINSNNSKDYNLGFEHGLHFSQLLMFKVLKERLEFLKELGEGAKK